MTARFTSSHHGICAQVLTEAGAAAVDEVKAIADYLSELMQAIHGGDWRVDIGHHDSAPFVLLTPRREMSA